MKYIVRVQWNEMDNGVLRVEKVYDEYNDLEEAKRRADKWTDKLRMGGYDFIVLIYEMTDH